MNYNEILEKEKYYVPVCLNLAQELSWYDIGILSNIINCERMNGFWSVRSLAKFTKIAKSKVQKVLKNFKELGLLNDENKINYQTLDIMVHRCNEMASEGVPPQGTVVKDKCTYNEYSSVPPQGTVGVPPQGTYNKDNKKEINKNPSLNSFPAVEDVEGGDVKLKDDMTTKEKVEKAKERFYEAIDHYSSIAKYNSKKALDKDKKKDRDGERTDFDKFEHQLMDKIKKYGLWLIQQGVDNEDEIDYLCGEYELLSKMVVDGYKAYYGDAYANKPTDFKFQPYRALVWNKVRKGA